VSTDRSTLVTKGEALWNDKSLSSNGLACSSCHVGNVAAFKTTFKEPYPHQVEMASDMGGLEAIDADGMVQLCMLVPMKAEILPWDSEELAALTAYVVDVVQPDYQQKAP
jgi:cytochrome c